jgi:hypothetical protein
MTTQPRIKWTRDGAAWRADLPGNVTLCAAPDHTRGMFGEKVARGSTWRASATIWDESTRTASRFGRDVYCDRQQDAKAAKALAESVYLDALNVA